MNVDISGVEMNDVVTMGDVSGEGNYRFRKDGEEVVGWMVAAKEEGLEEDGEGCGGEEREGENE